MSRICAIVYFSLVISEIKALVAEATVLHVTLVHRAVAQGQEGKGSEQSSRHTHTPKHQHCSDKA